MIAAIDLGLFADLILAVSVPGMALWLILTRERFRAVVGFMVYGLFVALAWMRLGAPDVALTEAAIGGGLVGLLLLGASARVPPEPRMLGRRWPLHLLAALLSAIVAAGLAAVVLTLPEPAPSLAATVADALPATKVDNPVTAVLMAFRAIDTLLETVVLVLALIAFWSLVPDGAWGQRPTWLPLARPAPALVLLARLLPPVGILVAVHLFWIGTSQPGGKFQAGALLAALWALTMIAGLSRPPAPERRLPRLLAVLGPAVFFAVGLAGIWLAGDFLAYPSGLEKPLILLIEAVLMLSVGVALGLILAGLPPASPALSPPAAATDPRAAAPQGPRA
jgi:multisubunit Na+/H+ antiporter MnhB subunit